ncbi:LysR family transcriptional regulator [Klebsiella aerogenes]|uniref:LysR family transcriptional regulator n=1 Tax=Klebsiella aerogenes TaxID=548 RepID=UPI00244B5CCD|nr:LysR family transcriptional regulator [Klebsiella aerogenes]MDH1612399.1 LysR family transcriptional regulator [Klebsiella aerogenes]
MQQLTLKQLDILNAVVEHGNATRAAEALNLSPSAVSYQLKTIRAKTGSPLFSRTRKGLTPQQSVLNILKQHINLQNMNTPRKTFIFSTYTPVELLLSGTISLAPEKWKDLTFRFRMMADGEAERIRRLRIREVDFDIGSKLSGDKSIITKRFLSSPLCVIVSRRHPTITDRLTLNDWKHSRHLRWLRDSSCQIESLVPGLRHPHRLLDERDISAESANLLALVYRCSQTNEIMLMPEIFARQLSTIFPVKMFPVPEGLTMRFSCYIHYHHALLKTIEASGLNEFIDPVMAIHQE